MSSELDSVQVTKLIHEALRGNRTAEEELIVLLGERLRIVAENLLGDDHQSIQATELVHLAWMRLFHGTAEPDLPNRNAFLAYVARSMRNLLIDYIRKRRTALDGPELQRAPVEQLEALVAEFESRDQVSLWDLNEALEELAKESERQFRTVELRYFGGMTMREIAEFHSVSITTVENDWRLARAKLRKRLIETEEH